jgi:uncharacterized membrane protein
MAHVEMNAHFEAPIEQVFDLMADAKRWPEWMPNMLEVMEVTGPLDQPGTRIHEAMRFLGRRIESWDEIVEAERPRLWKYASGTEGMKSVGTFRLTPAGQGTDVAIEGDYDLPAGFLGEIADRLFVEKAMERQMRHSLENFKALVEAKVLTPA